MLTAIQAKMSKCIAAERSIGRRQNKSQDMVQWSCKDKSQPTTQQKNH